LQLVLNRGRLSPDKGIGVQSMGGNVTGTTTRRMRARWSALAVGMVLVVGVSATGAGAQSSSKEKPTATDIGITAKEIRVAVIADVETPLAPGLFQGSVYGVQGWAKYVNKKGGLAGRKVVVDFIDSKLSASDTRNAFIKACQEDFVVVGASALFVNNVSDIETCVNQAGVAAGLPDFAVVTTEVDQQCSPTTISVNPPQIICSTKDESPQTYQSNAGRAAYYQKKFGKNLHGAYLYSSDIKAANNANRATASGMQEEGIKADQEFDISARAPQSAYTPIVQAMKEKGSNYAQSGSAQNSTVALRKEAKLQGLQGVKVWDCTLQCYDKKFIEQGGADVEGQFVSLLFLPFEEANTNAMLADFLKYTGKDKADGFGIQAWASGLLFAEAVNAAVAQSGVNGVNRESVFTEVAKINGFDAGGMLGKTNISDKEVTPCYALVQVKGGEFKRVWPTKVGTFDCKASNVLQSKLDLLSR